jgi:hypothetical protein
MSVHSSYARWCLESQHEESCTSLTFLRAAFASADCLQMASLNGLHLVAAEGADEEKVYEIELLRKQLGEFASRDLLLLAHEQYNVPWSGWLCAGAAESGDLAKLQWLHEEQLCPWYMDPGGWAPGISSTRIDISTCAERSGNVAMLRWLKQQGVVMIGAQLLHQAAVKGHLSTLQFLESELGFALDGDSRLSSHVCCSAAANRHLHVLQWLQERGARLGDDAVGQYAAAGGSVPVLSWLAEVLPSEHWTTQRLTRMLQLAGCHGSLEACIWLRQRGAEWPATLRARLTHVREAAWKQCVSDWARANGCTTAHPGFAEHSSEFAQGFLIQPFCG